MRKGPNVRFLTHDSPVWRDRADFIIHARVEMDGTTQLFEQIWAKREDDDLFVVCCIPFFAYDLSLGDAVSSVAADGLQYLINRVEVPSGRYVFRSWFTASASVQRAVVTDLVERGALVEWSSAHLLAIDAPDLIVARELADRLAFHEENGHLTYETGSQDTDRRSPQVI